MNASFKQCSLFLHPAQFDFTINDIPAFITALQESGLISQKIDQQESALNFYTGEKFLDYIAYMGCAPAIQFEPDENNNKFCQVKIHTHNTAKLIHSKTQARAPQCPHCNKPVKDWQQELDKTTITCNQCGTRSGLEHFNWRKMAGYARLFIEITDIFPKEAIPQASLMNKLADISDTNWSHFYSCQ